MTRSGERARRTVAWPSWWGFQLAEGLLDLAALVVGGEVEELLVNDDPGRQQRFPLLPPPRRREHLIDQLPRDEPGQHAQRDLVRERRPGRDRSSGIHTVHAGTVPESRDKQKTTSLSTLIVAVGTVLAAGPTAQIPASGITALGSCHGCLAANRT
jgi:hypothetical protein